MKNKIIWLIHLLYKQISRSFKMAQSHELHSKRLAVINYFGAKNMLELFGSNWKDYFRFKSSHKPELTTIIEKLDPKFIDDKISTLSNFKFALCFENTSFDGYITEKIIHCFIAGVVPIYLGADNIDNYIPKNCFIDYRNFSDLQELEIFLLSLTTDNIEEFITNGKKFLMHENGEKFSYEYFAQDILNKIQCINHDNH
jgi:hypothetical protein